jgi:hypothetical protein
MKSRLILPMLVLLVLIAALSPSAVIAQENSSAHPAALNTRVRSMIELGSV